ncbi:MAG: hypothetical protein J0I10_20795, partial [Verrucomicrobia bacterium]|nr:hypothetical protein [Verrucomicrobiota bacterium]
PNRLDHQGSTAGQKPCVIVDVHVSGGVEVGSSQTHPLNSPSHEQPPETSHLGGQWPARQIAERKKANSPPREFRFHRFILKK